MPGFTRTLPLVLTAALMAGQAAAPVRGMDLNAGLTLSPEAGSPDSERSGRSAGALQSRLAFDDDTLTLSGRLPWRVGDGSAEGTGGSLTELQAGGGGRIVVGVLQGLRQAEGQSWLSYAGIANDVSLGNRRLRLQNDLAFYQDDTAKKGARPGSPLDALGYRLRLSDRGRDGSFGYGIDFRFHGADFEAEGEEVESDSMALGLSSDWRLDRGLRWRAAARHGRSALSSDNPKTTWQGRLSLDQSLNGFGLAGWTTGMRLDLEREAEKTGAGEDSLSASLNLTAPLGSGWRGTLALRTQRERDHQNGETENLQAFDLRAERRLSLLGLSGRLSSKAFVERERGEQGSGGAQGLNLKLVLEEDGQRLELGGGLAHLNDPGDAAERGIESHLKARFAQERDGISFGIDAEGTRDLEEGAEISGGVFVELDF